MERYRRVKDVQVEESQGVIGSGVQQTSLRAQSYQALSGWYPRTVRVTVAPPILMRLQCQ